MQREGEGEEIVNKERKGEEEEREWGEMAKRKKLEGQYELPSLTLKREEAVLHQLTFCEHQEGESGTGRGVPRER